MVRAFGVERLGERQAQGTERRGPGKAEAGRVAQVVELDAVVEHVAAVGEFAGDARQRAGVGLDDAVSRVTRPARSQRAVGVLVAEDVDEVDVALRASVEGVEPDPLHVETGIDARVFRYRVAKLDATA